MDLVYLFGVEEMIPLYDKMSFLTYRNWDVYLLLWGSFSLVLFGCCKTLSCLCRCCGSRKTKVE